MVKEVTIIDIAERANVSAMTVSRVLSGKGKVAVRTSEKIMHIMNELNYKPNLIARSLASRKTKTIGIMIPKGEQLFLDNYIAQVLSGISDVAQDEDYRITLVPIKDSDLDTDCYTNYARSNLFDGMILLKTKMNNPDLPYLAESGFPFVLINYRLDSKKINYVDCENIKGVELAIDYLYNKNHRKIAFIAGPMDETNAVDRLKGYKKSLQKYDIPFDERYVLYGEWKKEVAYEKAADLLKLKDRPTAIFCSDDYMALGVIEQIKHHGLSIPKDIAVIGFDNIEIGEFSRPSLTTIEQPMYEIGRTSVQLLLDLISQKCTPPIRKTLGTKLVIRDSA